MADEKPLSFIDLMSLQSLKEENEHGKKKFTSLNPSFCPDGGAGAAFGGHVYAQAVWAASQTVGEGMVVHVRFPFHLSCDLGRGRGWNCRQKRLT
jgi:acyl-CoA thioesterase